MIKTIHLKNFTCFEDLKLEFCKGMNVLIGRNGTGKTHVLKGLAATMKANSLQQNASSKSKDNYGILLTDKLMGYFKPDSLGHLVNKYGETQASVEINLPKGTIAYNFTEKASLVKTNNSAYLDQPSFVYIPPREMFSLFDGFISLYENREISFDETYLDLAKSMDVAPLRNAALENAMKMLQPILDKWKIEVVRKGNRFYVVDEGKEFEAHLVAEGLRKIATVFYLCMNGELKRDSILFWDEPESNLNPTLISIVVDLLMELSKNYNIQVILSTHDYLLSHKLSLFAEYASERPEMRFFSFKKEGHRVTAEMAETLLEINHNPILEEYSAFYDLENQFISTHHG